MDPPSGAWWDGLYQFGDENLLFLENCTFLRSYRTGILTDFWGETQGRLNIIH